MNIYVASSWRNDRQPGVVAALREQGHHVYDFREPRPGAAGFSWRDIDPDWQSWTPEQLRKNLEHPVATHGFGQDLAALQGSDLTVLVLPSGRSAHLEAGFALGRGQRLAILLSEGEPELMYGMAHKLCLSLEELLSFTAAESLR